MSTAAVTPTPGPTLVPESEKSPKKQAATLMEISVSRSVLLAELTAAQTVITRNTTQPILANLLIVATDDGMITLGATNLEQGLRSLFKATVKTAGAATIPARKLYDYVKLLPECDVSIKMLENNWVQIRAGRSNTKMVGLSGLSFPAIPEPGAQEKPVVIPVQLFRSLIGHIIMAVSTEESRYTLNGALLVIDPSKITMAATDGHRLAVAEKEEAFESVAAQKKVVVPHKALNDLASLMGITERESIHYFENETTIFFRVGNREYSTRKLTGQFPNYTSVIPRGNPNTFIVRTSDLEKAVQRVSQFADSRSNSVKITIADNAMKLSSSSVESGESEETLEVAYSGLPITVGFNAGYVTDFTKSIGGTGEIKMSLKDGQSAGLLEPEGGERAVKVLYTIMPMRI